MKRDQESQHKPDNRRAGTQMGLGIALGVALGVALHNIALGLSLGILVGGAGVALERLRKKGP